MDFLGKTRTLLHYNPLATRIFRDQWWHHKEQAQYAFNPELTGDQFLESDTASLAVRPSRFGNGLFAMRRIPEKQVLLRISGRSIRYHEALSLGDLESYPIQVSLESYILTDFPFYYINHSCDPNTGVSENLEVIALRDIEKGEEIFWDYSTSMLERHWTMVCGCGSPFCRGIITDFDLLPFWIQQKYLRSNIVQPFIKELLVRFDKSDIDQHINAVRNDTRRLLRKEVVH